MIIVKKCVETSRGEEARGTVSVGARDRILGTPSSEVGGTSADQRLTLGHHLKPKG